MGIKGAHMGLKRAQYGSKWTQGVSYEAQEGFKEAHVGLKGVRGGSLDLKRSARRSDGRKKTKQEG